MLLLLPAPSSPSRHHRRRHQRPQRRWSRFELLLLSAPVHSTQLIVHKYSWCALQTKFLSNDFIYYYIYIFSAVTHTFVSLAGKKCKIIYLAQPSLFLHWYFSNVAQPTNRGYDHRNQAIQTTLFRGTKKRKKKKKTKTYSNFGTVEIV